MARSLDDWGKEVDERPVKTIIMWVMGIILFSIVVGWMVQGNDFFLYKVFAPKREAVRREVYEQTKSYKQGSTQRLGTLCSQVATADSAHVPMLNDMITHEFV